MSSSQTASVMPGSTVRPSEARSSTMAARTVTVWIAICTPVTVSDSSRYHGSIE